MGLEVRKKIVIALAILLLTPVFINLANCLVYRPVMLYLDGKLSKKAEQLAEGMNEDKVVEIMGRPKKKEFLDINVAINVGFPEVLARRFALSSNKILWYSYYVPVMVPPLFLRSEPVRSSIDIFFDSQGKVVYIQRSTVARTGDIFIPRNLEKVQSDDKYN